MSEARASERGRRRRPRRTARPRRTRARAATTQGPPFASHEDVGRFSSNAFAKCSFKMSGMFAKSRSNYTSCLCILHFFLFYLSVLLSAPSSMNNPCAGTSSFISRKPGSIRDSLHLGLLIRLHQFVVGVLLAKNLGRDFPMKSETRSWKKKVERSSFWCFHCKKGVRVNSVLTTVMLRKGYCRKQCSTLICKSKCISDTYARFRSQCAVVQESNNII